MTRVLTILAAIVALAVAAAPVASAGPSKGKVPRPGVGSFSIDIGTSEKVTAARTGIVGRPKQGAVLYNGHAGLVSGINTAGGWDPFRRSRSPDCPARLRPDGATPLMKARVLSAGLSECKT